MFREKNAIAIQQQKDIDHLEGSIRLIQAENNRLNVERQEQTSMWNRESAELQQRVQELIAQSERQRLERDKGLDKYRDKAAQYKQKFRLALQNV